MPIYQYNCAGCERRVEVFFRSASRVEDSPACPECGKRQLTRVMSRFARVLTKNQRLSSIDWSQEAGRVNDRDPRSYARWAREMGRELDDELGSDYRDRADDADDVVNRIDAVQGLRMRVEDQLYGPPSDPLEAEMRNAASGGDHGHDHDH